MIFVQELILFVFPLIGQFVIFVQELILFVLPFASMYTSGGGRLKLQFLDQNFHKNHKTIAKILSDEETLDKMGSLCLLREHGKPIGRPKKIFNENFHL